MMRSTRVLLFAAVFVCAPLAAQQKAPARIHIIGASVSGGFEDGPLFGAKEQGDSVPLKLLLKKWCDGDVRVSSHPPLEMWNLFRNPVETGKKEIELCKRRKPDLVVAIDFPFWFAYGYVGDDEAKERMQKFERGLELLDQLKVPVILGDLPNMRGAARRMLSPKQVPSAPVLKQLNARLRKYADEHDNVTIVPLSKLVAQLQVEGVVLPLADGPLRTRPKALLQEDRLHATRLGMAFLAYQLQDALRAQFPKGHRLREQVWQFEDFVEAAGAEGELEQLQDH